MKTGRLLERGWSKCDWISSDSVDDLLPLPPFPASSSPPPPSADVTICLTLGKEPGEVLPSPEPVSFSHSSPDPLSHLKYLRSSRLARSSSPPATQNETLCDIREKL